MGALTRRNAEGIVKCDLCKVGSKLLEVDAFGTTTCQSLVKDLHHAAQYRSDSIAFHWKPPVEHLPGLKMSSVSDTRSPLRS